MHDVIEIKPGVGFKRKRLEKLIPDTETLLFVAKLYKLDAQQLGEFMYQRFGTHDVISVLLNEGDIHSHELQDYLIEAGYGDLIERGMAAQNPEPPKAEVLPEVWKSLEIRIVDAIQELADTLKDTINNMPGKTGAMAFQSMMQFNARRPVIGDYRAGIKHKGAPENIIVLDVSGSVSENTVSTIINEVVAMAWEANAYLAIVSNSARWWMPGEYDAPTVLAECEFAGTHYEELAPLFDNRHWGVVVTIADYDSSPAAKRAFSKINGTVDTVLDISLVNCQTYLSEVVGTLAKEVRPILMGRNEYVL